MIPHYRIIELFFYCLFILSPSLFFFRISSSYSLGTVISLFILAPLIIYKNPKIKLSHIFSLAVVLGLLCLSLIISAANDHLSMPFKALFGLIFVGLLILVSMSFPSLIETLDSRRFEKIIRNVFTFYLISLLVFSLTPPDLTFAFFGWIRPVFPFSETSHFAIAFAPVLLFTLLRCSAHSRLALAILLMLCQVINPNLTLFAICLYVFALSFSLKTSFIILTSAATGILFALFSMPPYFLERLNLYSSNNLSALVFRQGWDLVFAGMTGQPPGLLGFQQLQGEHLEFISSDRIRFLRDGLNLNEYDGGFIAAKIFAELGILGWPIVLLFVFVFFRSFVSIVRASRSGLRNADPLSLFLICCSASYIFELFARGVGYFSIGTFLFLISVLSWKKLDKVPQ